jgi:hypothetical protein
MTVSKNNGYGELWETVEIAGETLKMDKVTDNLVGNVGRERGKASHE